MASFREYANFIWSVADLIRDSFKRGKYQDVILHFGDSIEEAARSCRILAESLGARPSDMKYSPGHARL